MKAGDLVMLIEHQPFTDDDEKIGIVTEVLDYHWDCDLPGYVKGGETFKVHWPHKGSTAHYAVEELQLINDSEDLKETTPK